MKSTPKNLVSRGGRYLRKHKIVRKMLLVGLAALLTLPAVDAIQFAFGIHILTPKVTYNYSVSNETVYCSTYHM